MTDERTKTQVAVDYAKHILKIYDASNESVNDVGFPAEMLRTLVTALEPTPTMAWGCTNCGCEREPDGACPNCGSNLRPELMFR
jgi:rubrerythrin